MDTDTSLSIPTSLRRGMSENVPDRILKRYASLKSIAETSTFGQLDDCVVLDTECTGVSFKHDNLTQIAAARVRSGKIVDWFITFVNPGMPIPPEIVRLTHIHDKDVADAPDAEQATAELVKFVGNDDVIAHNATFDETFCTKPKNGKSLANNTWIDSLDVARIVLPRMKSHRLIDLTKAFDVVNSTHRADADVRSLVAVYRIMLAGITQMPYDLLLYIANLAPENDWPSGKVFQVFAGMRSVSEGHTKLTSGDSHTLNLHFLRTHTLKDETLVKRHDAEQLLQDPIHGLHFVSDEEISDEFGKDGIAGRMYKNYEPRPEQIQMATAINDAFSQSKNLAVEAGTGVGKSLAYLVPALKTARANNITVGIATKTNALLDQLANHELPAMKQAGADVDYSVLKGTQHYICLLALEQLVKNGAQIVVEDNKHSVCTAAALAGLVSFVEQSTYEDIDALNWDRRAIPRRAVTIKGENCLKNRCPYFGKECYAYGARSRAESSDILITNQTLLFCDIKADGGILPPIRYWIIDEAHGAEDEARRAFSKKIDVHELQRLVNNLAGLGNRDTLSRLQRRIAKEHPTMSEQDIDAIAHELDDVVQSSEVKDVKESQNESPSADIQAAGGDVLIQANIEKAHLFAESFKQKFLVFAHMIRDLQVFKSQGSRRYSQQDIWINEQTRSDAEFQKFVQVAKDMCDEAERLLKPLSNLVSLLDEEKHVANLQREIAICVSTLKDLVTNADIILFHPTHAYAYSAHLNKSDHGRDYLEAQMLYIGQELNETLYAHTHSVVYTSATLTTNRDFRVFGQAMGLNQGEDSQSNLIQIPSSYDFDHHMTVYVITDSPEPGQKEYVQQLSQFLSKVHIVQNGATLTLFTNRREMEKCFDQVDPVAEDHGLHLVCQKYGIARKNLRDQFIQDEHLSLFALKSFWEGFDAPGATLKSVVIPKLPFTSPTDPLYQELNASQGNAWFSYTLPRSIIEIKQAAGRLIRSSTDTGNLILYDRRITTRRYGKQFVASLPSTNVKMMTAEEALRDIASRMEK